MAHISLSLLKKTLLATGALTLMTVAAPAAYAGPGDHSASKHRHSHAKVDHRREKRAERRRDRREHTRDHRSDRHDHARHRRHTYRRDHYRPRRDHYRPRRDHYRPARHYNRHARRHARHYNRHHTRGHYTPYRSRVGISFHFGTPGYSRYRWAPAAHSFYRPVYGSYAGYRNRTTCRRITVEGWHHGHRELVSVKECSNPWDGTYIVQGSERVIDCRW